MKYYLPTSTLNFNSIFATESISPHSFYLTRKFGYKRNDKIDLQIFDDYLLLYNIPIIYDIDNSDIERYPFLIEIEESVINNDISELFFNSQRNDISKLKIYTYPKSIYLNNTNFRFIFSNDDIKKIVIAKSLSSLETKSVDKYKDNFILYSQLNQEITKILKEDFVLNYNIKLNPDKEKYISIDEIFNNIKGCIYSSIISRFFYKNEAQLELNNQQKNILNNYSSLKSELENNVKLKHKKLTKNFIGKKTGGLYKSIEKLKVYLLTFIKCDEQVLIEEYLKPYHLNNPSNFISDLKKINNLYDITRKNANNYYINNEFDFNNLEDSIKNFINNYYELNYDEKLDLDQRIKRSLSNLSYKVEKETAVSLDNQTINRIESFIESINGLNIFSFNLLNDLTKHEINLLEIILNNLFQIKNKNNEINELEIKKLLINVGSKISDSFGQKSRDRKYLLKLYDIIINKKSLKLNDPKANLLNNFSAFILNTNSIEKLENYIAANQIKDFSLSFSFWGAYNGFSYLPKTFTQYFYYTVDKKLLSFIDQNLIELYELIERNGLVNLKVFSN